MVESWRYFASIKLEMLAPLLRDTLARGFCHAAPNWDAGKKPLARVYMAPVPVATGGYSILRVFVGASTFPCVFPLSSSACSLSG